MMFTFNYQFCGYTKCCNLRVQCSRPVLAVQLKTVSGDQIMEAPGQ